MIRRAVESEKMSIPTSIAHAFELAVQHRGTAYYRDGAVRIIKRAEGYIEARV
jgi:hypothetical protein